MSNANTGKLRTLFLVSRDYGEALEAIYFASEPGLESYLLIHPSLHAVYGDDLPVPFRLYDSIAEVIATVEKFQPDVVFLFCGYLFAHDGIFSFEALEQLLEVLRQRGCRVLTSDPFFGWLRELDASGSGTAELAQEPRRPLADSLPSPLESLIPAELAEQQKQCFVRDFARAHALLGSLPQVYDVDPGPLASGDKLVYSNPAVVLRPGQAPCSPEIRQALRLDPARPRWVFVVAKEEYRQLTKAPGKPTSSESLEHASRFHELLTDQLYQALDQGRQPVLIAPEACTSAVALISDPADGLVLLPHCRHRWFVALALEAEYVFYWNMFSNSLKLRALNRLPFFLSDWGHIAHSSRLLQERMAHCYYVMGVPPCLDFRQPLDADALACEAAKQEPMLHAMADHLLRAPRPAEALRLFLERAG